MTQPYVQEDIKHKDDCAWARGLPPYTGDEQEVCNCGAFEQSSEVNSLDWPSFLAGFRAAWAEAGGSTEAAINLRARRAYEAWEASCRI